MKSRVLRFADEIIAAAENAAAAGFNAIEIQCDTGRDPGRVNRALAAAAAVRPDLLDDEKVSEHWEPSYVSSDLTPTWFVPIRPDRHENPWNIGGHNSPGTLFLC